MKKIFTLFIIISLCHWFVGYSMNLDPQCQQQLECQQQLVILTLPNANDACEVKISLKVAQQMQSFSNFMADLNVNNNTKNTKWIIHEAKNKRDLKYFAQILEQLATIHTKDDEEKIIKNLEKQSLDRLDRLNVIAQSTGTEKMIDYTYIALYNKEKSVIEQIETITNTDIQ